MKKENKGLLVGLTVGGVAGLTYYLVSTKKEEKIKVLILTISMIFSMTNHINIKIRFLKNGKIQKMLLMIMVKKLQKFLKKGYLRQKIRPVNMEIKPLMH